MRPIAKPILVLVAILLGVPAVVATGLSLYLQSQDVHGRLLEQLSNAAGSPVTIRGIVGLPLGGIRISGVMGGAGPSGTPATLPVFSADSVSIHPDYQELLRGKYSVGGVVVVHPAIHLDLESGLKKSAPAPPPTTAPTNPVMGQIPSPEATLPTEAQSGISETKVENKAGGSSPPLLEIPPTPQSVIPATLRNVSVTGGEFTLRAGSNVPVISFSGIALEGSHDPLNGWSGRLEALKTAVGTSIVIHGLKSPITLSKNETTLSMEDLSATLGAGKLSGKALLDLPPSALRYSTTLKLSEASLKELLADASMANSSADGAVSGEIELHGIAGIPSSMAGKGSLKCTGALIQPVDFLKQIGQLLQVQELQLLRLSEANALFHVEDGRLVIDDLFLRSENLILTAKGPLHPTGELDLQARLLFNANLTGRLKGLLGPQLTPAPEPGYSQVAFHVSGTVANPKTDLLERLTGIRIGGDLGGLLQGLFSRPTPRPATVAAPAK